MKLMRYSRKRQPSALSRLGVLVGNDLVADLRAGYALYLVAENGNSKGAELAQIYMPAYIAQFLHIGEPAWRALGDAYSYLAELASTAPETTGIAGESLFMPLSECRLYAPVRPSKLITISLNYPRHGMPAAVSLSSQSCAPRVFRIAVIASSRESRFVTRSGFVA